MVAPPAAGPDRSGAARLDRRTLLLGAFGAVLATAGCTPPGLPPVQTPTSSGPEPSTSVPNRSVIVGIDATTAGFNPHAIADFSPVTMAVAALVLPSATWIDTSGHWQLNPDLAQAAEVSSRQPFTVTYTLDRAASWSDGTPITGEDFSYLWQQMSTAPGVFEPAGYRLISQVRSRQGGKLVEVEFAAPFPDWQSLFHHLLPAHILKDAPGGWAETLSAGIPVSGSYYKMASLDTVTGEITLQRNDKYWGSQRGPASVVLRMGATSDLLGALSRGDVQAAELRPGPSDGPALATVPAERRALVPLPAVTQLVFDTTAGPAADVHVRTAIAHAIDAGQIREVLAGGTSGTPVELPVPTTIGLAADAVLEPGKVPPSAEAPPDIGAAVRELAEAGYRMAGLYVARDGATLVLRIGYPLPDRSLAAAGRELQRQLGSAGIEVDLVGFAPHRLLAALTEQRCDAALITMPHGASDAVAASSQFGCPPDAAAGQAGARNPSGWCSLTAQAALDDALTGAASPDAADHEVTRARPALALAQPAVLFVAPGPVAELRGPDPTGPAPSWVFESPLSGIVEWPGR
ncbi:MAG TPA: ABC transporter family substrate-binding protein [Nakamurella sp.]|nr:ABC transporter family substrate-binding protein [Nakamurella sp.]